MAIEFTRASRQEELEEILTLQEQNLASDLTEEEIEKEGFVTVSHTLDLLSKMNVVCPHIIAKDKGRVIGYALCMHPDFSREIPVLLSMFEQIREVVPKDQSYMVMGQVCIDQAYRGKGVFRGLYKTMKRSLSSSFELIVTEVDSTNLRSLNAHCAIGFRNLLSYPADGRQWHLISLTTN